MFVIDLIAGINYLYERNSNAFFNVGMSFVWLFAALKGRNIWVDRLGWIIWGIFLLLRYGGWSIKILKAIYFRW